MAEKWEKIEISSHHEQGDMKWHHMVRNDFL